MNSVRIDSLLPKDDSELKQLLQSKDTIELARDQMMLDEVLRVLNVACGSVVGLKVLSLTLLKGSEERMVDRIEFRSLEKLETLKLITTFQPGCFKQMGILQTILSSAHSLQRLELSLYEHRTEAFLTQIIPGCPDKLLTPLFETKEEKEMKLSAARMVEGLMALHGQAPAIDNGPSGEAEDLLDRMLDQSLENLFADAGNSLVTDVNLMIETNLVVTHADQTSVAVTTKKEALKFMSLEQYGEVSDVIFGSQLPETLKHLCLKAVLQGSKVRTNFLYLPALEHLDLSFCQMDDAAFATLAPIIGRRMPALNKLVLERNQLQEAELGLVIGPELEELHLQHNPLTSRAATHLFDSMEFNRSIHLVDMSDTSVSKRGLSLRGLRKWWATPARLVLPAGCFDDEELIEISMMCEGVEFEMEAGPMVMQDLLAW
jgi:hypothetical protein